MVDDAPLKVRPVAATLQGVPPFWLSEITDAPSVSDRVVAPFELKEDAAMVFPLVSRDPAVRTNAPAEVLPPLVKESCNVHPPPTPLKVIVPVKVPPLNVSVLPDEVELIVGENIETVAPESQVRFPEIAGLEPVELKLPENPRTLKSLHAVVVSVTVPVPAEIQILLTGFAATMVMVRAVPLLLVSLRVDVPGVRVSPVVVVVSQTVPVPLRLQVPDPMLMFLVPLLDRNVPALTL